MSDLETGKITSVIDRNLMRSVNQAIHHLVLVLHDAYFKTCEDRMRQGGRTGRVNVTEGDFETAMKKFLGGSQVLDIVMKRFQRGRDFDKKLEWWSDRVAQELASVDHEELCNRYTDAINTNNAVGMMATQFALLDRFGAPPAMTDDGLYIQPAFWREKFPEMPDTLIRRLASVVEKQTTSKKGEQGHPDRHGA